MNSLEGPIPREPGEPEIKNIVAVKRELQQQELLFNLKLTDLSTTNNPFVVFENKKIDENGYLLFQNDDKKEVKERKGPQSDLQRQIQRSVDNHFQSVRTASEIGESETNNNMMDPA